MSKKLDLRDCIVVRNDWLITNTMLSTRFYGRTNEIEQFEFRKQAALHDKALNDIVYNRKVYHMTERIYKKGTQPPDRDAVGYALITTLWLTPSIITRLRRLILRQDCYAGYVWKDEPEDE